MIKDRLESLRAAQKVRSCDGLIGDSVISLEGPMGEFLAKVDEIRAMTKAIEVKASSVKQYSEELLLSPFDTSEKLEARDILMLEIKRDSAEVRYELLEIERSLSGNLGADVMSRTVRTQYNVECMRLQAVMHNYNASLLDFSGKFKARLKAQCEDAGHDLTDDQLEDMLSTGTPCAYTHDIIQATRMSQHLVNQHLVTQVETRFHQYEHLEKAIAELHELFVDLALLVNHQSSMVDDIAAHVDAAQDCTAAGQQFLQKAAGYKKKQRKKMVFAAVLVVSVVFLIVIILSL